MGKELNNSGGIGKGSSTDEDYAWLTLNSIGASLRTIEIYSTSTLYVQTVSIFKRALAGHTEFSF